MSRSLLLNEIKERREKVFCFYCDVKYNPSHKCKNQKLLRLEILEDTDDEYEGEYENITDEDKEKP